MWVKELGELIDLMPYYLLICLPVFIALSPINPVDAASELDVHRLAQFDLAGVTHGSKQASLTMEARGPSSSQVLRKTVVAKMSELSVAGFRDLVNGGAGGLVLLIPGKTAITAQEKDTILQLEEELLNMEQIDIPVYFAQETDELLELYETLKSEGEGSETGGSAFSALVSSISNSGYQLVVSASNPQPLKDQSIVSTSGILSGSGSEEQAPTILVVAHYDAAAGAPNLAMGADSNGSGVSIVMELARIFSSLYASSRTHPVYNLVFLLSGGGKINYAGTKRWLEEHLDLDATSDMLANVEFVLCLDTLGKDLPNLMHVSKPPKEGSPADKFFQFLRSVNTKLHSHSNLEMIHKKINLAEEALAWEHERFSIRRLPAMTLSQVRTPHDPEKSTILDTVDEVSLTALQRNTRIVAESLACFLYPALANGNECSGDLFSGSTGPTEESLSGWLKLITSSPRHPVLLAGKNSELVRSLTAALARYTKDVTTVSGSPDRRDPDFSLYDTTSATLNIYRVKPAVFDLLLSSLIGSYLLFIYFILLNSSTILSVLASMVRERKVEEYSNGHSKMNGFKNGHKLHIL